MRLKELKSYSEVQEGDYFPNFFTDCIVGASEGDDLACGIVTIVDPHKEYFSGLGGMVDGDFRVFGPQIKNVVLLRKKKDGLELLAGENVFNTLNPRYSQTSPKYTKSKELLKK